MSTDSTNQSPRPVDFWVDPICPFCWTTARWLVDEVLPHRDLAITWRPISLFFKNSPEPGSEFYDSTKFTLGLLRVMESLRRADGNDAVFKLYWEYGARIHHDGSIDFDPADALAAIGADTAHAAAFDDESWDAVVREGMDAGLALVGHDVGTPIIAVRNARGERAGYFGPVITSVPPTEQSLAMWDALAAMMEIDSFFELKRARSSSPDPGDRPAPR